MFLIESFRDYRTTEPIWFRYLRGLFAIVFTTILIVYSINKVYEVNIYIPTNPIIFTYPQLHEIDFNISICTGISNVMTDIELEITEFAKITNNTSQCQTVHRDDVSYHSDRNFWFNITTAPSKNNDIKNDTQQESKYRLNPYEFSIPSGIPDNMLLLCLESIELQTYNPQSLLKIYRYNLTELIRYKFDIYQLESNYFLLNLGQASIITFKPMIANDILELMPRLEQIPMSLKPNELRIGFEFPSYFLRFKESGYEYTDLIADVGGFYGAIAGKYRIFYLLFGMQKLEPWGLVQKYLLSYIPFRQSFTRKFAKRYVTYVGLPIVEKIELKGESPSLSADPKPSVENNSPFLTTSGNEIQSDQTHLKDVVQISEKLEYLKDRVQMLEILLKDYYLDDYLLKKVKFAKL
ncbi:15054_t:CDS:2 [Funneliformis mosseae]|uniref:15054_t:CDS:1 n=1 Tax=Funneliformis mosseae TaxID=27381 RepID=A0A9N9CA76_FUNMO|nr:15054_t:CDS:2 [Funneliformis mosseae]